MIKGKQDEETLWNRCSITEIPLSSWSPYLSPSPYSLCLCLSKWLHWFISDDSEPLFHVSSVFVALLCWPCVAAKCMCYLNVYFLTPVTITSPIFLWWKMSVFVSWADLTPMASLCLCVVCDCDVFEVENDVLCSMIFLPMRNVPTAYCTISYKVYLTGWLTTRPSAQPYTLLSPCFTCLENVL